MNSIKERLEKLRSILPENCTLVAVSKTKPNENILEAYEAGQKDFGENKVQELARKADELPKDIRWHMIGHLQRNKVKYLAPFVYLIHGVDSIRLLNEINKQAEKNNRVINCLLQVHIANEESKFGFDRQEIESIVLDADIGNLSNVRIVGLMGMATNTSNQEQIKEEFSSLNKLYEWSNKNATQSNIEFSQLSMGMSGDYEIALGAGSTMIRVGSLIFGERNYATH